MTANFHLVRTVPQWMTETPAPVSDIEKRISDLQRRHTKTRELLVSTLSLIMVVLANLCFEPKGFIAIAGVTWTTMAATNAFARWYLRD